MSAAHLVTGPFSFKGKRLTFSITDAALALQYWGARESGADVVVTLTESGEPKEIAGKVHSVELLAAGDRRRWQVVMNISGHPC